jgi:integrase
VFLRQFLEDTRRQRWVDGIDADAVFYHDDVTARAQFPPRFISEPVMAQLESEANLAKLSPSFRHLVVVITETGLRAGDACALASESLVADSAGWPCLRFYCSKMRAEQLVPLSARAVEGVRTHQAYVSQTRPAGSRLLFPSRRDPANPTATGCSAGRSRTGRPASACTTAPAVRSE